MNPIPHELAEHIDQDLERVRAMSLEEHGRVLDAVCSAAVDIYEGRLKMGLPPNQPEEWPESTLQFFRRHAPNAENQHLPSPTTVAFALAGALEERNAAYFLSPDKPSECIRLLQEIGCDVPVSEATALLQEHGFCRATYSGLRVDVFFPTIPFYELAKSRRRRVPLKTGHVMVWDAATLAVFKMMFFREKDLLDLKQILRKQGSVFESQWVRNQLVEICGERDARTTRWDEIVGESKA